MIDPDTGEVFVFVRTPYNYDMKKASDESGLKCDDETRAQQQFAEECDINTIVRRFGLTGQLPEDLMVPQSGDFTNVVDYQTAMNVIRAADEAFMELPGDVRDRFAHDPGKFLEFVNDENNLEEARKLGIANAATQVPVVNPTKVVIVKDETAVPPSGTSST